MESAKPIIVGTASWSIPSFFQDQFPPGQMMLERYSRVFPGVEINSSFYNFHRPETFRKWSDLTPEHFQFSIKLHKDFTHQRELFFDHGRLREFIESVKYLGNKWKVLLVQLPPKLEFNQQQFCKLITTIRKKYRQTIVIEPRHESWNTREAQYVFRDNRLSLVVADPEKVTGNDFCETAGGLRYFRLHGSPELYRSSYHPYMLELLANFITEDKRPAWCIFDNTASGNAVINALTFQRYLQASSLQS